MAFDELLVTGATWALALGAAWALLVLAAAVVEVVSDGRLALTTRLGCPATLRRVLLAGLGVVLASGGAVAVVPVAAAPAPFSPRSGAGALDSSGLPVPARPTGAAYSLPRQRVVVEPGDNLWSLCHDHAGRRTATQDVARLVERTYRANRREIGPDPDLIHPGQRLRIPQQRPHPPTPETP